MTGSRSRKNNTAHTATQTHKMCINIYCVLVRARAANTAHRVDDRKQQSQHTHDPHDNVACWMLMIEMRVFLMHTYIAFVPARVIVF